MGRILTAMLALGALLCATACSLLDMENVRIPVGGAKTTPSSFADIDAASGTNSQMSGEDWRPNTMSTDTVYRLKTSGGEDWRE